MTPGGRLWDARRLILYLPAAKKSLDDLDGSRESDIRKEARNFLRSPSTAFSKHPRDYVSQIKHRPSKTRGFATWCQNDRIIVELCVVHDIYRKENEDEYWRDIRDYDERGEQYVEQFESLTEAEFNDMVKRFRGDSSMLVVSDDV